MGQLSRQDMIDQLVTFSLNAALGDRDTLWLREMFERGFRGFAALSHAELVREMQFRGLLGEDTPEGDPEDALDGANDDAPGNPYDLLPDHATMPLFAGGE
jgi:hypothetical protein